LDFGISEEAQSRNIYVFTPQHIVIIILLVTTKLLSTYYLHTKDIYNHAITSLFGSKLKLL